MEPTQSRDFEGNNSNECIFTCWDTVNALHIVLKSTAVTEGPAATYRSDSWHLIPTGAAGTEVIPTQHEVRLEDDAVVVSQALTYKRA